MAIASKALHQSKQNWGSGCYNHRLYRLRIISYNIYATTSSIVSQARPNPKSGEGSGHSLYISLFLALCTLHPNQIAERHEMSQQQNRKINMEVSMIEAAGRCLGFQDKAEGSHSRIC